MHVLPDEIADISDTELVNLSRVGTAAAFGELWRRHHAAALAFARGVTHRFDADDLVSEAFTRVYRTIAQGGGPSNGFRRYLFTAIRNLAVSWARKDRELPIEDAETIADDRFTEESQWEALDQSLAVQAYRKLPEQWKTVLWYREIEGLSPRQIAPLIGTNANAVAALNYRAREALRAAWIQAHLNTASTNPDCRRTIERLGVAARRRLSKSVQRDLEAHILDCRRCAVVATEADQVNTRIRSNPYEIPRSTTTGRRSAAATTGRKRVPLTGFAGAA